MTILKITSAQNQHQIWINQSQNINNRHQNKNN